jgi:hypothetical protein
MLLSVSLSSYSVVELSRVSGFQLADVYSSNKASGVLFEPLVLRSIIHHAADKGNKISTLPGLRGLIIHVVSNLYPPRPTSK